MHSCCTTKSCHKHVAGELHVAARLICRRADQGAEENYDVGSWDFVGSGARRGSVSGFFSGLFSTFTFVAAVLACIVVVRAVRRRLRRSGNRGAINRRLTY